MGGAAAVGVHDDLAPGQAGVALGTAYDEAAGGIDVDFGVVVEQLLRDHVADDVADHVAADHVERGLRRVLGGEDHRVDTHRTAGLVIFDCDLGLAVGPQIVEKTGLAHLGQAAGHPVGQRDRQRHQLFCLAAGIAEHHALVAGAVLQLGVRVLLALQRAVHAERDVAGLLVDVGDDAAGVAVKAVLGPVIADGADDFAEISPMMWTRPVETAVSQATRPLGSCSRIASSTASEIWSQILSGCPSVTDSEVKR